MIIELKEHPISEGMTVSDRRSYPVNGGLFLVDDGVATGIAYVNPGVPRPYFIPVPPDVVKSYIRKEAPKVTEADISARMKGLLEEIKDKVDRLADREEPAMIQGAWSNTPLDSLTLLKAIALVQRPELATTLLKDNY